MIKIFFKIIITIYFFMASALAENIKDLEISGNKRISKDTIIVLGKIKITENYDTDRLNNVLKNLYNTNFFNNINLSIENQVLKIDIIENPIIEDVEITGVKNKKLLETINNEQIHHINNRDLEYIIYKINDNYSHN